VELPYSVEVYAELMAAYNEGWLPATSLAPVLSLLVLALALWPPPGHEAAAARLIGALLAAAWLWVGWAHQLGMMAGLNFLATLYGAAWLAQGALLALTCAASNRTRFRLGADLRGRTGLALALFGLAGYPALALLLGLDWPAVPLAGTAPEPTAIFTSGLLLGLRARPRLHLLLIPLGWAGVSTLSAYLLAYPLDFTVAAAVLAALALGVRERAEAAARFAAARGLRQTSHECAGRSGC